MELCAKMIENGELPISENGNNLGWDDHNQYREVDMMSQSLPTIPDLPPPDLNLMPPE